MKHPEPEKIRKVADLLMHTISKHQGYVNMDSIHVTKMEVCGTTACHAGWYLLAKEGENVIIDIDNPPKEFHDKKTYEIGAELLAQDLGFDDKLDLEDWAGNNPKLWGNTEGQVMFYSEEAFGKIKSYAHDLSVEEIAEHWRAVADRIEALQK